MKSIIKKSLFILPALLLAGCNFKFTYNISGLSFSGGEIEDDEGIEDSGTYDVKIWVDDRIVELTKTQIGQFVAASGGKYTINATIEPVGEAGAASSMLQDVQDGADIFCFAQDQLSRLKVAGALAKLSSSYVESLEEEMGIEAVNAARVNDDVYAFPITSDNGYFLYYDKSVISDEDATDMTKILEDCKKAGRTLNFEARSNGFYAASYFMATGCYSSWTLNSETGKFESYNDNYNSAAGLEAAKGLKELDNKSLVAGNSQASKLGSSSAAVVSGIWEYEVALKNLGDNLGCAELPYFHVGEASYHLSSFDGYKLLGVKPQVDARKASVCRKIARFLTGEECQGQRFDRASWGPTNKAASQKESVLAHAGLQALAKQHEYARAQGQCPGAWFTALATTAKAVTSTATDDQLRLILQNYENGLPELLDSD
jgi:arabinogalactan oligomer/maltooligosaccharide transport system substrate-binding protein